jgi:hypothetical protein
MRKSVLLVGNSHIEQFVLENDAMFWSVDVYKGFEGTCYLHLQCMASLSPYHCSRSQFRVFFVLYQYCFCAARLPVYPEEGGNTFLRNVDNFL